MQNSCAIDLPGAGGASAETALSARALTCVIFDIAEQGYALPVSIVREIIDVPDIAALPGSEPDVMGVVDVRGEIVPVLDIAQRLGQPASCNAVGTDARVIVLERVSGGEPIGVVVDHVRDVIEIAQSELHPAPETDIGTPLVASIARINGRLTYLLTRSCIDARSV